MVTILLWMKISKWGCFHVSHECSGQSLGTGTREERPD